MGTSEVTTIIAIAWLCNLWVSFYVSRCIKKKLPIRKPFGCERCLGFWIALIYFSIRMQPIETIIIFACFTSLTAVILRGVVNRLND